MPEQTPTKLAEGTVFRVQSGNYSVQTETHGVVVGKLRGNLKKELIYSTSGSRPQRVQQARKRRSTDPLAVGDRVRVDTERGTIDEILPRHAELARLLPESREQHVLVANLDRLFVVFAVNPRPDLWQLDRFLVMAEAADIPASVVLNKVDLLTEEDMGLREQLAVYERIGYPVLFVSARAGLGLETLRAGMQGRITAFAGPSGVGKSSLLNALKPGLRLRVGEVGDVTRQGRHTTTTAELIPFADDSWIADTPGLRQVNFWQVDKEDVPLCFPEFAPYRDRCRFNNCRHHTELGCAVRAAAEAGIIDSRRYQSYVQMT
ncbi:MAG: ribosome small subunit-dependent GTPase A [Armatimonadetes bacterium]|nr:ribosome small subunit-dependent GTPase A [Armatimonadota bacterium]